MKFFANMSAERIGYIDFAKGFAILGIVWYHALQRMYLPDAVQQAAALGGTGVHLFFALSGFGLALSPPVSPGTFYRRRMVKIWLPYALALSISVAVALLFGLFPDRWDAWLACASLWSVFQEKYIQAFGGHFWFVGAIMCLYAVFPLLRSLQQKIGRGLFIGGAVVISVGWWCAVYALDKAGWRSWNSFFLQFLWEFALGMAAAACYRAGRWKWGLGHRYAWLYLLAAGAFFFACMALMVLQMGATGKIFNDVPAFLGYTSVSMAVFLMVEKQMPRLGKAVQQVGGFSYTLYLVHVLVLEMFVGPNGSLQAWSLALYTVAALAAGWAFHVAVERLMHLISNKN